MLSRFALCLLTVASFACSNREPQEVAQPAPDTSGAAQPVQATASAAQSEESLAGKVFGDKPLLDKETPLPEIVKNAAGLADQTIKTRGTVKAVCKKAGCWMEIATESGEQAHIKMAGHAFFVPRSCSGHEAIVQGTVKAGPPQNECGSKDACGGAENGAVAKIELVATGVEFIN